MPIGHITNGVHVHDLAGAADAPGLRPPPRPRLAGRAAASRGFWEAIESVDDGELWETHQTLKARLIDFARRRAVQHARARGASRPSASRSCRRALSLDALTIGFARRFATYKRANLILQDLEAHGRAGQRSADAGAVRVRRQGASARPARARTSCSRSPA